MATRLRLPRTPDPDPKSAAECPHPGSPRPTANLTFVREWRVMRDREQSILSEVLPPEERVIEAVVARYQRVAPAVTRFARTLSGNDELNVRLGSQASASGDDIVIDPGVFQAAYSRAAPVTPTEVALASALHEAVHLVATNFEERRPIPPAWLPDRSAGEATSEEPINSPLALFPDEGDDRLSDMDLEAELDMPSEQGSPDDVEVSLLHALAEVGGPAAIAMFLSLEDARQELVYFAGYPGARSVLTDLYEAALSGAMREARPLGQFALACFLLGGEYADRDELQRRLLPHAAAALDDAVLFLDMLVEASDAWEVGTLALELLEVARLHNLLTDAGVSEKASNRRLQQDVDEAAIAEGVDAVRMLTPVLQSAESYEQTRQAAQSVAAQQGKKSDADQAGDPATDQLVRVSESPTVYLPTGQGGKLVVSAFPDRFRAFGPAGRELIGEAATRWNVAQRRISGELYPLFLANQRRGLRSGYDAGDLSPYSALLLGAGLYERMFERRDLPTRRSYGVSVLVDGSASMLQPRPLESGRKTPWALAAAILGAWTLAQLCDELQIEFEVALFNRAFPSAVDDTERSYSDRRHQATGGLRRTQGGAAERLTRTVNHYLVKPFAVRWRNVEDTLAGLFWMAATPAEAARETRLDPTSSPPISMFDKAANVDEFNVSYAARRLSSRNVSTRILVVLADGMTRGSVQDLADSVSAVEHAGTTVLGIGIGDQTVQAAYSRNQVVEQPDELARAMVDGVRSTLFQTIAGMGGTTWWAHSSERTLYDPSIPRSKADA